LAKQPFPPSFGQPVFQRRSVLGGAGLISFGEQIEVHELPSQYELTTEQFILGKPLLPNKNHLRLVHFPAQGRRISIACIAPVRGR
jgi:hypothetical protein